MPWQDTDDLGKTSGTLEIRTNNTVSHKKRGSVANTQKSYIEK